MMVARRAAGRMLVPFAQQVTLSVVGTIVATLVITAVEHGTPSFRDAIVAQPELTSGGKFAARAAEAEADDDGDAVKLPAPPLLPPLRALAAAQANDMPLASPVAFGGALADHKPPLDLAKSARHMARADARHRPVAEATRDIVPPRRIDYVVADAAAEQHPSDAVAVQADSAGGLWSSTKMLLGRTATYGNTLIDSLMP